MRSTRRGSTSAMQRLAGVVTTTSLPRRSASGRRRLDRPGRWCRAGRWRSTSRAAAPASNRLISSRSASSASNRSSSSCSSSADRATDGSKSARESWMQVARHPDRRQRGAQLVRHVGDEALLHRARGPRAGGSGAAGCRPCSLNDVASRARSSSPRAVIRSLRRPDGEPFGDEGGAAHRVDDLPGDDVGDGPDEQDQREPAEGEGAGDEARVACSRCIGKTKYSSYAPGRRQRRSASRRRRRAPASPVCSLGDRDDLRLLAAAGRRRPPGAGRPGCSAVPTSPDRTWAPRPARWRRRLRTRMMSRDWSAPGEASWAAMSVASWVMLVASVLSVASNCVWADRAPCSASSPGLGDPGVDQAVRDLLVEVGAQGQDHDEAEQHGRDDDAELQRRAPEVRPAAGRPRPPPGGSCASARCARSSSRRPRRRAPPPEPSTSSTGSRS